MFVPILSSPTPQLFSQGQAWPLAWGFCQVEKEVKGGREPADMQDLFPGDEGVVSRGCVGSFLPKQRQSPQSCPHLCHPHAT